MVDIGRKCVDAIVQRTLSSAAGVLDPGRLRIKTALHSGTSAGEKSANQGVLLGEGGNDALACVGGSGCSVVGYVIEDRVVLLVADGAHHRGACGGDSPHQCFVAEGQ